MRLKRMYINESEVKFQECEVRKDGDYYSHFIMGERAGESEYIPLRGYIVTAERMMIKSTIKNNDSFTLRLEDDDGSFFIGSGEILHHNGVRASDNFVIYERPMIIASLK